jgi:carbon monoxide dehydrogenase subunit G
MPCYRATIHIPGDRQSAFAYLSRFDRAAEWDPGVTDGVMLTGEPVGPGSRFRLRARFLGRSIPLDYEIVEFDPHERMVLRAETGTIRSTDTITFGTDGSGTLVHYEAVLEAKGLARVAEPLLAVAFRRIGDRAAAGLRVHLRSVPSS